MQSEDPWWSEEDREYILSELQRTTSEIKTEIDLLTEAQWNFRESTDRWSIAEIIEHLEMQNQLHYREIYAVGNAPQYIQYRVITEGKDQYFKEYASDPTPGKAQWFLEPLGRFCSKEEAAYAFYRAREKLTEFVAQTDIDLRKQFTLRVPAENLEISEIKIGQVRDLHQLLLTGIAHTDRHLRQIRKIKEHVDYPNK